MLHSNLASSYIHKRPEVETAINMSSTLAQEPEAYPEPREFKPKDNPAFILHGKLHTSYETVR